MRNRSTTQGLIVASLGMLLTCGCGGADTPPNDRPPGASTAPKTAALEAGAAVMQAKAPVDQIAMYLVGFHPSKSDPQMQMESHHYCDQVNEDFVQCVLYDGNTDHARLHGVEYIISAKLYDSLPAEEKAYWHPHNYEILSGQLRMPGLPAAAEDEALKGKINSYGKTWHFWKTGVHGEEGDSLPLGPPHLAWSFNHDGEAKPGLVEARDSRMRLDTGEARRRRADWSGLAQRQGGVNAIAGSFPAATGTPAGVADNGDSRTRDVPVTSMR
jgi:hypothetical protein